MQEITRTGPRPSEYITLHAAHAPVSDIHFNQYDSPFGPICIASCAQGITHMLFDGEKTARQRVLKTHPQARLTVQGDAHHQAALSHISAPHAPKQVWLALTGTPFQIQVWKALLDVALGETSSYGAVAQRIARPKAARAVGAAIGKNPISFIVPCHRILAANGSLGGYYWGSEKKKAILDWEAAQG